MGDAMTKRTDVESVRHDSKGMTQLAKLLGYDDKWFLGPYDSNGNSIGSFLEFLDDNPGACEAIVEFVLEHGRDREGEELEEPCQHEDTYVNDRQQEVCRECDEELGR